MSVTTTIEAPTKTKTAPSWRDVLPVHPAADLFPLMSEGELRELGEDIRKHGQTVFIAFLEVAESPVKIKGKPVVLLDGRNRLDAYEVTIGHKIDFETMHTVGENGNLAQRILWTIRPAGTDPYAYVLSANIHRRHLTAEQRRDLIAKVLKAKPEQSNVQIAKQVKADDKTVAKVRKKLESTSEIPKLEKTVGKDGKERPTKRKTEPKAGKKLQPVVEQKVFGSPEAARAAKSAKPLSKQQMRELSDSWLAVHSHITRGNLTGLKDALQVHRDKIDRVLERLA
jgi:hypothetical protein